MSSLQLDDSANFIGRFGEPDYCRGRPFYNLLSAFLYLLDNFMTIVDFIPVIFLSNYRCNYDKLPVDSEFFISFNYIYFLYHYNMWHYRYIDSQLRFRLNALADIKIEEHPLSSGNYSQVYKYNGAKILAYNRRSNGILMGNFIISTLVKNDPKHALGLRNQNSRGTWGLRLVLSKCGDNDLEKFNYISELLYQVILSIE